MFITLPSFIEIMIISSVYQSVFVYTEFCMWLWFIKAIEVCVQT